MRRHCIRAVGDPGPDVSALPGLQSSCAGMSSCCMEVPDFILHCTLLDVKKEIAFQPLKKDRYFWVLSKMIWEGMGRRLNLCMDGSCAACHGEIHQICSMLHKSWIYIIHRGMISFLSIFLFLFYLDAICCQSSPTEIQNSPVQHPTLLSLCPLAEHHVPDRKMQSLPFSAN